ncbi:fasciclin domain-containing protein [Microbacterium sp. 4-7]|uniref:fasciclin domain-containing protein n=1 Tax=Microbacterium sp. 4-7 TaxID=1885327 RepID=UPI0016500541|nr:fasciclin domain-containing protein [Microbacterium sp. 4-7]MBC6495415.1 hypothetical protein [Microbacterium sp. 4-7]
MTGKIRASLAGVAALALVLTAAPAQAAETARPSGNIVDVLVTASGGGAPDRNANDYDLLVQAVLATGLDSTLADPAGTFTVFAPNDRAFLRLVSDLTGTAPASEAAALTTLTTAFTTDQIADILLYHVVAGKKLGPIKVITSNSLTMANGGVVRPRGVFLRDESPTLRDPALVLWRVNITANNGVIHTIDRVLVPAM